MTVDLLCAVRAFVDLTLVGLDALPGPGEERHADDLVRSPGGGAVLAVAAARLGLRVVVAAPLGADEGGDFIRAALAAEGVTWVGRVVDRTPTTVVLPAGSDRAMATVDPRSEASAAELAAVDARAVVLCLGLVDSATAGPALYVAVGDAESREFAGRLPAGVAGARAMFVNEREALTLTGATDAEAAAAALAEQVPCVVVTLGARGAIAATGDRLLRAEGLPVTAVDSTCAGDLFLASYVWADLAGAVPVDRLRWAVLHSARSVQVRTALAGAATADALLAAGADIGLVLPHRQRSPSDTEQPLTKQPLTGQPLTGQPLTKQPLTGQQSQAKEDQ